MDIALLFHYVMFAIVLYSALRNDTDVEVEELSDFKIEETNNF